MKMMKARFAGTCGDCGGGFPKGADIDFDRLGRVGKRTFHSDCNEPRRGVSSAQRVADADPSDARYRYFAGDTRPFAHVRIGGGGYGWRAGNENTGRRCEDAPCCGCC